MNWLTNLVGDWTIVLMMVGVLAFVFAIVEFDERRRRRRWHRLVETIIHIGRARRNGHT